MNHWFSTVLLKKQNTKMTLGDIFDALSERGFSPSMIMLFLPDEEVSIDCLDTEKGLIVLPRTKEISLKQKSRGYSRK